MANTLSETLTAREVESLLGIDSSGLVALKKSGALVPSNDREGSWSGTWALYASDDIEAYVVALISAIGYSE